MHLLEFGVNVIGRVNFESLNVWEQEHHVYKPVHWVWQS